MELLRIVKGVHTTSFTATYRHPICEKKIIFNVLVPNSVKETYPSFSSCMVGSQYMHLPLYARLMNEVPVYRASLSPVLLYHAINVPGGFVVESALWFPSPNCKPERVPELGDVKRYLDRLAEVDQLRPGGLAAWGCSTYLTPEPLYMHIFNTPTRGTLLDKWAAQLRVKLNMIAPSLHEVLPPQVAPDTYDWAQLETTLESRRSVLEYRYDGSFPVWVIPGRTTNVLPPEYVTTVRPPGPRSTHVTPFLHQDF